MKFLEKIKTILDSRITKAVLYTVLCLACLGGTAWALYSVATGGSILEQTAQTGTQIGILDRYDQAITNQFSASMEGILSIDKVYWLRDEDVVAPKPDQELFGKIFKIDYPLGNIRTFC